MSFLQFGTSSSLARIATLASFREPANHIVKDRSEEDAEERDA